MTTQTQEHDRGLRYDLQLIARRTMQRRQALTWLLSGGAATLLASCGGGGSGDSSSGTATSTSGSSSGSSSTSSSSGSSSASSAACIQDPTATNGPYPSDGSNSVNGSVSDILTNSGVIRSDIRSSFGTSTTTAPGVALNLTLTLMDSNTGCAPLSGYAVYIWHCNRDGAYSLYSGGIQNENYLRGVQLTDSNGQVTFESIFPGCYSGRYPHIHFEVYKSLAAATQYENAVLISQFAMPRDICRTVYDTATGYSGSVSNLANVTTSSDNVFDAFTAAQITAMTPSMSGSVDVGYTATANIGIAV